MVTIDISDTPNPNAKRVVIDQQVQADLIGRSFSDVGSGSDLVDAVLSVPNVAAVMTLPSSVTVTVASPDHWPDVIADVTDAIRAHFSLPDEGR